MSVSEKYELNYCQTWMTAIEGFADLEQQKKCWFSHEGPVVTSYEDEVQNLMSVARSFLRPKYDDYLSPKCRELLRKLVDKISDYHKNPETYLRGASYDELFSDPKWMEVVKLAQKTFHALETFKKEAADGKEISS